MKPMPTKPWAPTLVALVQPAELDHSAPPPPKHELRLVRDDDDPPPLGGGGAAIIEAERTSRQRLVADHIDRNIDHLQQAAKCAARRYRVDAGDVLSQATINMLQYRSWDESRPFLPWACTVVLRAAVGEVRKARRQPHKVQVDDLDSVNDPHAAAPDMTAASVERADEVQRVLRFAEHLTVGEWLVLVMRLRGARLNATQRRRVSRALAKLRGWCCRGRIPRTA